MANRWETMETETDFILEGSKITADAYWSHEIRWRLLLGRKLMTNLDSILKSRDISFPTKVHLVKAIVFPVVMHGCESWTIKKAEHWRIDAFELWCWRRLLRVPWTARRSNQFILKEISPGVHWKDWCWSWNSNTLATWCEQLTHLKRPWCWERLRSGGEGDNRGWDGWMASPTRWTWLWVNSWSWWWAGRPGVLQSMGSQRVGHDWATELNWFLGVDLMDDMVALFLTFEGTSILFCIVATSVYVPTTAQEGSLFFTSSPVFVICRLFDDRESKVYVLAMLSINQNLCCLYNRISAVRSYVHVWVLLTLVEWLSSGPWVPGTHCQSETYFSRAVPYQILHQGQLHSTNLGSSPNFSMMC